MVVSGGGKLPKSWPLALLLTAVAVAVPALFLGQTIEVDLRCVPSGPRGQAACNLKRVGFVSSEDVQLAVVSGERIATTSSKRGSHSALVLQTPRGEVPLANGFRPELSVLQRAAAEVRAVRDGESAEYHARLEDAPGPTAWLLLLGFTAVLLMMAKEAKP